MPAELRNERIERNKCQVDESTPVTGFACLRSAAVRTSELIVAYNLLANSAIGCPGFWIENDTAVRFCLKIDLPPKKAD
jgi:hypothetical protein